MTITLEELDHKIAGVNKKLERYREGAKSTNWEYSNGSKAFIRHAEAELEILELARLGMLSMPSDPVRRIGGPQGHFPCKNPNIIECRMWECQEHGACRLNKLKDVNPCPAP